MFYLVAIDLLLISCFSCKQIYPSSHKQKTPRMWGYFVSMLRPNLLTGDDDEIKEAFYGKGPISSSKYLITKNLKIKEQPKAPKIIVPAFLTNFCC